MPASLCKLPQCTNPETCALCDIIRRPRPLSAREISRLQLTPRAVDAIGDLRKAELQRQIDAEKARNAALRARVTPLQVVPRPTPTAPMAAPPVKAPAPAPLPPPITGELQRGDWAGLAARVDAGQIDKARAEEIGAEWLREVKTRAMA